MRIDEYTFPSQIVLRLVGELILDDDYAAIDQFLTREAVAYRERPCSRNVVLLPELKWLGLLVRAEDFVDRSVDASSSLNEVASVRLQGVCLRFVRLQEEVNLTSLGNRFKKPCKKLCLTESFNIPVILNYFSQVS